MVHRKPLTKVAFLWLFVAVFVWASAPAMADPSVLSFGYNTLAGSFTSGGADSGMFVAQATRGLQGSPALFTTGTVSRLVDPKAQASFNFWNGFANTPFDVGSANFVLSMSVTNIDRVANTARGTGTLVATDIDGDTITANVSGYWTLISGQATFAGSASNLLFSDPLGTFNGQFGSSFSTDFSEYQQMVGVVTDVTGVSGGLFGSEFSDHSSLVTTQIIPAPGAALLGMLGLVTIVWVKKRIG